MKTLILSGYGTNCERETAPACRLAGSARARANRFRFLSVPGGGTLENLNNLSPV